MLISHTVNVLYAYKINQCSVSNLQTEYHNQHFFYYINTI